ARTELEDELNQLRAEAQTAREEAQQVAMRIEREAEERIQREIATARARLEEQSRRAEAAEIARQNVEEALIRLRE
ncbi:MAG: ribonuclease Y, partial [Gammaproteobacteria bacterium]|nr:ribonuclease Y [Gammaproteobacteria bacterium]NIX88305.1 ribonuclease Y [Gammaproteobacteria bacterium]